MNKKYYTIEEYTLTYLDDDKAFSGDNVVILPKLKKGDIPIFDGNILTFKKELNEVKIPNCYYGGINKPLTLHENCFEDIVPIITVTYQLLLENTTIITSIIDLFKNHFHLKQDNAKFRIVSKKANGDSVIITYDGPVGGIESLTDLTKELK